MKELYAVKDETHKEIFKSYDNAMNFFKTLMNGKIKGFYTEKDAKKWLDKPIKTEGIYVVFNGRVPGIYFTLADMKAQVEGFEGANVGRAKSLEDAEEMFANSRQILRKAKKEKRDPELVRKEKVAHLKRLKLSYEGNVLCFIDCEAQDEKAISIGAVVYNKATNSIVNEFYSVMRPAGFVKLDKYIENLTGLTTEEIAKAKSASEVNSEFLSFLSANGVTDIFSWSNNDKSFLKKNSKGFDKFFDKIKDLQPYISAITVDKFYCPRWSLADMKYMYDIDGQVKHNALSDAIDLCKVFRKWDSGLLNTRKMEELICGR